MKECKGRGKESSRDGEQRVKDREKTNNKQTNKTTNQLDWLSSQLVSTGSFVQPPTATYKQTVGPAALTTGLARSLEQPLMRP